MSRNGVSGSFGKKEGGPGGEGASLGGGEQYDPEPEGRQPAWEVGGGLAAAGWPPHGGAAWVMRACVASGGLAGGPRARARS